MSYSAGGRMGVGRQRREGQEVGQAGGQACMRRTAPAQVGQGGQTKGDADRKWDTTHRFPPHVTAWAGPVGARAAAHSLRL